MMVITACPAFREKHRRQPEKVFGAQGDTHEGVIFHLRHRDDCIRIVKTGTQCIAGQTSNRRQGHHRP